MLAPDTVLNDRYRLIEQIGEGGMATVYRALDTRLGRTVAVKILHPEYARDRPFVQRFQQEAEFAASLGAHPNIVAIYDIGQDGSHRYIVMELVEGRSLKQIIRERAPLSVSEAFSTGRQVASALDFAHKRGLVHRDIKPQNIMVTTDGVAKVTDFGIAQSVSASQLTNTGMVIGTVHYFSPEQAQGKSAAPASDIYSLGIILYEMLTGKLPFDAENAIGVAMQHLQTEPPSPWNYNPGLPTRAVTTTLRALEKDPARRYRDAAEFAAALATPMPDDPASGATTISPIMAEAPRQRTAFFEPMGPVSPRRTVAPQTVIERRSPSTAAEAPTDPWRTTWLALGALLAVLVIAALSFFAFNKAFGGSAGSTPTSTATPSPTATPQIKKHKRTPTPPQPTVPIFVPTVAPTFAPPPPTDTPQPTSPPATSTPKPPPPTDTPQPATPTSIPQVQIIGPTATETATG